MMGNRSNLIIEVPHCSDGVSDGSDVTYPVLRGLVNNCLSRGSGGDTLIGGDGADTFVLSKHTDTVNDFSIADGDVIEAPDNLNLRVIQRGNHLLLKDLGNNNKTTLLNTNNHDLLAHQPDLI